MKLYHFALFFAVIAAGFFVTSQIVLWEKLQGESRKKTEYDCLVAAVDAAVEVVFEGSKNEVTEAGLTLAEEVFFQTLALLREGSAEKPVWESWRERIPCFVVFAEKGYYRYDFVPEVGYGWSEMIPYDEGKIPESFFIETENTLSVYAARRSGNKVFYRVEQAEAGVWERSLVPPCVFAVYATNADSVTGIQTDFLYAAAGRRESYYYVTEDTICHLPWCKKCISGTVVARYETQKESAEDGAMPCAYCLMGETEEMYIGN